MKKNTSTQASSKFEEKFLKHYSEEERDLLASYDLEQLKQVVSECEANIIRTTEEVKSNEDYMKAAEILKDFNKGLSEVRKFQNARKNYCLQLLDDKGAISLTNEGMDL